MNHSDTLDQSHTSESPLAVDEIIGPSPLSLPIHILMLCVSSVVCVLCVLCCSGSVPRVPWFRPSVDLFSLGVGCEWCEPLYIETPHTPDTTTQDKELTKGFPR